MLPIIGATLCTTVSNGGLLWILRKHTKRAVHPQRLDTHRLETVEYSKVNSTAIQRNKSTNQQPPRSTASAQRDVKSARSSEGGKGHLTTTINPRFVLIDDHITELQNEPPTSRTVKSTQEEDEIDATKGSFADINHKKRDGNLDTVVPFVSKIVLINENHGGEDYHRNHQLPQFILDSRKHGNQVTVSTTTTNSVRNSETLWVDRKGGSSNIDLVSQNSIALDPRSEALASAANVGSHRARLQYPKKPTSRCADGSQRSRMKGIKTLVTITLSFYLCWLPFLVEAFFVPIKNEKVEALSYCLPCLSTWIQPLVHFMTSERARKIAKEIFANVMKR